MNNETIYKVVGERCPNCSINTIMEFSSIYMELMEKTLFHVTLLKVIKLTRFIFPIKKTIGLLIIMKRQASLLKIINRKHKNIKFHY